MQVTFRPSPDTVPVAALLRQLLKHALWSLRVRCVAVKARRTTLGAGVRRGRATDSQCAKDAETARSRLHRDPQDDNTDPVRPSFVSPGGAVPRGVNLKRRTTDERDRQREGAG